MTLVQCSHCLKTYQFQKWIKLPSVWIDEKKKDIGRTTVCECGRRFSVDKWQLKTEVDDAYTVSTVHLEFGHPYDQGYIAPNVNEESGNYWYETMIYDKRSTNNDFLSYQVRYRTKEEAIKGHEFTVKNINRILESPDKYPQDIISVFLKAVHASHAPVSASDRISPVNHPISDISNDKRNDKSNQDPDSASH